MAEHATNKSVAKATVAMSARDAVGKLLEAAQDGTVESFKIAARRLAGNDDIAAAIPEVKDANGRGPLHFAARGGNVDVCKYLIEDLNMPVNQKDEEGDTPLVHAARLGHYDATKYLLEHGADGNTATALHHAAASEGSLELLRLLLEHGASVDAPSEAGTPLVWAAGHGNVEAVRVLLEKDANPNVADDNNATALISGAASGSSEIVKLLLQYGADVNANAAGVTALHVAAGLGDEAMVNMLLEAGADPNANDRDGATALEAAAAGGFRPIVDRLLAVTSPTGNIEWTADALIASQETAAPVQEEMSQEMLDKLENAKVEGAQAFREKDYARAVEAYSQALDIDPMDAKVYSNRSLCWTKIGEAENALRDAKTAVALKPDWTKAHYREGVALRLLERFEDAAGSFYEALKLEPGNVDLQNELRETVEAGRKASAALS